MQDRHIAILLVVLVFGMVLLNVHSDSYTGQAIRLEQEGINTQNPSIQRLPIQQAPTHPSNDAKVAQVLTNQPASANQIPLPAKKFAQALTGNSGMKGAGGVGYAVYNPYAPHDVNKGFMDGKKIYNQNNQMYAGKK